jgi:hypothetical protein
MGPKLSLEDLRKMTALQVLEDDRVRARFINTYNSLHKSVEGEYFYEKEKYNLMRVVTGSADLKKCTAFSMYGVFLDIAAMGLTLDQTTQPLFYVLPYNQKVGRDQNGNDVWEKRAVVEISPYGELALRIQAGQIKYADRPVIVYEGDTFQPIVNDNGQKIVRYQAKTPRQSKKIIGSFIRLTRPDGSFDFYHMLEDDIARLKGYSARKNRDAGANTLYTSDAGQIDSGFLEAKTIKHAFRTFPKIRLGQFSQLQRDEEPVQTIDYGLDDTRVATPQTPDPEPFGAENPDRDNPSQPKPVTVEDKDDVF